MPAADFPAVAGEPVDGPAGPGRPANGALPDPGGLRARADTLRARRTPYVQATVVRAVKPTSAKAGDRALVLPDGTIDGFVGGTCAESSVRLHSLRVLRAREPVVLRIVPEAPPAGPAAAEQVAGAGEETAGISEGLVTVHNPCASGGMLEIFLEGVFPPPLVLIWGGAPIARALRALGQALGYDMRDPGGPDQVPADAAAVVVASHGRDEEGVLAAALRAGVPYVGLVASRRRGGQVLAGLDVPAADARRVHTPAGLDIGARTPAEVALSIFAEIVAERPRGTAGAAAAGPVPAEKAPVAEAAGTAGAAPEPGIGGELVPSPEAAGGVAGAGTGGETVDPVCGMTVALAEATPHLQHDGRMWYFCGPGCRQAFADDPARYQG